MKTTNVINGNCFSTAPCVCGCGQIVRASKDDLHAHCNRCGSAFDRGFGSGELVAV